jgi:hypothetical protein
MRFRLDEGAANSVAGDPFADLFFTLAAIVLIALVVGGPQSVAPQREALRERLAAQLNAAAEDILILSAGGDGVRTSAAPQRVIAPDAILTDAALRYDIATAQAAGKKFALVIDRNGLDTAFQLESLLGDLGVAQIAQARAQ